jgi:uncharacterized membrane protein
MQEKNVEEVAAAEVVVAVLIAVLTMVVVVLIVLQLVVTLVVRTVVLVVTIILVAISGTLVRQRTTPTERPPLVGKVSANFSG